MRLRQAQQASPTFEEGKFESVTFGLILDDLESFETDEERAERALEAACGHTRLSDVSITFDDERVTVDVTNRTTLSPSRVLHSVWAASEEKYLSDPKADGRLRWARGFLVEDEQDDEPETETETDIDEE